MISTTNFIGSDGVDVGSKLLEKEYFNSVYLNIANQYITPELWVWGKGDVGQLGNNTGSDIKTPATTFSGGANWKAVNAGNSSATAIKTDGTLWVWGNNSNAQLGTNTFNRTSTPVTTFAGGTNWKQVSCGFDHAAAIKTDGSLWTWGEGNLGKLGINRGTDALTPVTTFAGGFNWKQVSCGTNHTAAVKTDGTLWTWGGNSYGLGNNDASGSGHSSTPITTFLGGTNWKQVSCGNNFTAAIKTDGTLWTWGGNSYGNIGDNTVSIRVTPVTTFAGGNNWKEVACGIGHIIAVKTDGTLWTWGQNTNGQLGNNKETNVRTPITTFAGGTNWNRISVSASGDSSFAIKKDGTLWVWGANFFGNLGNNFSTSTAGYRSTPVTTFAGGNNWRSVSAGGGFTIALKSYED